MFRSPGPGTFIIRSAPHLRRTCRRSCAKLLTQRFYDARDSFDPINLGVGVWDRYGELRELTCCWFSLVRMFNIIIACHCNFNGDLLLIEARSTPHPSHQLLAYTL